MSRISTEFNFIGSASTGPLDSISTPTGISVTFFGAPGVTTYSYRISALNNVGETLASSSLSISFGSSSLSATNFNRVSWNKVFGANSYKVYGRTLNSELFMSTISSNVYFDDFGSVTPSGGLPTSNTTGYSANRTSMGTLMTQKTGQGPYDNWVGPFPVGLARPSEFSTVIPTFIPHAIRWSTDKDWVFFADNAAAVATRRILYATYNRSTNAFAMEGFVTLGFPSTTVGHTVRGFKMTYDIYNTGSVFGTSTIVRGTNTAWLANGICQGSRIGFGAPDPNYITRWYEILNVTDDNSIILSSSLDAGISTNTPYCIEDLRALTTTTNTVSAGGGLFVTKGLRPEIFTVAGITVGVATVDSKRATYWLRDGNVPGVTGGLNTSAIGLGLQAKTSFTSQLCYVLDGTTLIRSHVYNVRAPLLGIGSNLNTSGFTTGSTFSGWLYSTGAQLLTGTASQINNSKIATLNHGPGAGVECVYFTTGTRVYRAALSDIVNNSVTWIADCMVEIPPGSANTYAATGALLTLETADTLDRLIINSSGATAFRNYLTRYQTFVEQFDIIWGLDTKQLDQTLEDANAPIFPNTQSTNITLWSESGLTYINRNSTVASGNQIYVVPFGAHWGLQTNQRIISAAINTPNAVSYSKAVIVSVRNYGSDKFAVQSEPYNLYYRTNGITDNSGAWTLLPETGNLTGISPASQIQFMIEFKIVGNYCLPARIFSIEMIYNVDDSLPAFLQWNFSDSNNTDGTVGFIQRGTYGSVPVLQINYYRADNDINLLSQTSSSTTYGNFQYWSGAAWVNGIGSDTDGLRRRFVPSAGLPSSTNVYAKIKVV